MSFVSIKSTLVLLGMSGLSFAATIPLRRSNTTNSDSETVRLMASTPQLEYDPQTTADCTWWYDNTQATNCNDLLASEGITLANFRRWNPSINEACTNLAVGKSYCVEAAFETVPSPTDPETPPATTTAPSNGVETPQPTQPSLVENCNKFYFVNSGESCAAIASSNGITLANFLSWNPKAGSNCAGLWADAYACVGIIGSSTTPTPTNPGNGIETPQPPQPSMVDNCNKFYLVKSGDSCAAIASSQGITLANFLAWNKGAGSNCGGLWADAYACVGVVGGSTTPTNPGNGIQTPTPIQTGMTTKCKSFHFVESGQTCAVIAPKYGVTVANLISWNPAVGSGCNGMWAETYLCVAVL
ncbi:LysM domain-containing protein [Colletotrichum sp. SAR11_239]|nr:LysM domain-containing protein [Colletotrichum sp. SAR11_239]